MADEIEISESAKARAEIASEGGKARAATLTPDERKEIARRAAETRWGMGLPQATHAGELKIGTIIIPCAVLQDGTRVLSESGLVNALGLYRSGAVHTREKEAASGGAQLPLFVAHKNIKPFVGKDLTDVLLKPLWYVWGASRNKGINARLIPKICEVWLKARDAGGLGKRQQIVAANADLLIRGLADVGIIALVDEATGYQYGRARHALEQILEQFISKELLKWAKMFPDEFYQQMFRLKGWKYNQISPKRPLHAGKLTNNIIYQRLAPGVLEELKRVTPRDEKGRLKHKYFQRLTEDVGHDRLREHLAAVIALMRACDDWPSFYKAINRALPKQVQMPLFDTDWKFEEREAEADSENNP